MDVDGSFCVTICGENAETEFLEKFLGGVRINGLELLDSLVYGGVDVAVCEVVDGRKQVVHTFSALE